jgi:hypothetical protein
VWTLLSIRVDTVFVCVMGGKHSSKQLVFVRFLECITSYFDILKLFKYYEEIIEIRIYFSNSQYWEN